MAKYADYVKDNLEQEIQDSSDASQERRESFEIPERFKGKTLEDVVKSYVELEGAYSRQGNTVGTLRQSIDTMLALQSQNQADTAAQPSKEPLKAEDLYEDPDTQVRRVVREEADARISQLEQQVAQDRATTMLAAFTEKYPSWKEDVRTDDMLGWIKEKPYRIRLAVAADKGDLDAADELFGNYYDNRKTKQETKKQERRRAALDASLESSGASVPELVESYSRSGIVDKKIAAARGDEKAKRWLDAHGASIQAAYAEGRVTD